MGILKNPNLAYKQTKKKVSFKMHHKEVFKPIAPKPASFERPRSISYLDLDDETIKRRQEKWKEFNRKK